MWLSKLSSKTMLTIIIIHLKKKKNWFHILLLRSIPVSFVGAIWEIQALKSVYITKSVGARDFNAIQINSRKMQRRVCLHGESKDNPISYYINIIAYRSESTRRD